MIHIIAGDKGKGKTKALIDKVNNEVKVVSGELSRQGSTSLMGLTFSQLLETAYCRASVNSLCQSRSCCTLASSC